jgi:hypothetical protein
MSHHQARALSGAALAIVLAGGLTADAGQARRQSPGQQKVAVSAALKIGGESISSTADGACTHAPSASIYDIASEMWTVRQEENGRSIQLTLWHPKAGGADMFTLSVSGRKSLNVSTVRGGTPSGSGTVRLERTARGGTFSVDAKSAGGEAITGTIQCGGFTAAVAEGG